MIIKHFEINKINLNKTKFILLFGKNEGLKNQVKIKLLENKTITSSFKDYLYSSFNITLTIDTMSRLPLRWSSS